MPPKFVTSITSPVPVMTPTLIWPGAVGHGSSTTDLSHFPERVAISARRAALEPEPMKAFVEAVKNAVARVLIMDQYLFKADSGSGSEDSRGGKIERLLDWFPDHFRAADVRLMGGDETAHNFLAVEAAFKARAADINRYRTRSSQQILELKLQPVLDGKTFPFLHDRFAIVDTELWHFGSTVGGLHPGLTAASRGWPVDTTQAMRFFDAIWNDRKTTQRHGGK
jgi:phosphatidylserine/phosphatidylglycerophosphate/cardiolipin synthase-like enzyme